MEIFLFSDRWRGDGCGSTDGRVQALPGLHTETLALDIFKDSLAMEDVLW